MKQGEPMIADTLSSVTDTSTSTTPQIQNENTPGQDEFLKQLQELQSKTNQHKSVQDQLLADRQEKTVQSHEKTDEQLDLELDEQRQLSRNGGYSSVDLRRGVDLAETSGDVSTEQHSLPSEWSKTSQKNKSQSNFFTELQNPSTMLPESAPLDSETNVSLESLEPRSGEYKPQQPGLNQATNSRTEDQTVSMDNSKHASTIQAKVSISGMTPVIGRSELTLEANLETKIAAAIKQIGEVKGKHDNTITKEAVTSTSEVAQQQGRGTSQHTGKESAATQMFPQTSLVERVDQAKLTQRITNVFRSLGNQDGTVRMKLHPEELGSITLRMKTEDGKVSADIETETETAKNLLLDNLEQLRDKLAQQNIQLDSFDVEVRPDFQQNFEFGQNDEQERAFKSETNSSRQTVSKVVDPPDESIQPKQVSLENHHIDVIG